MKRSVLFLAAPIVLLLVFSIVALAQMPCSPQTIAGTYAFKATGEAFLGGGAGPVPYPSVAGALTPITTVGIVQIHPNGHVSGSYWGNVYGFPTLKVENFESAITLDASCVGEWSYDVKMPGSTVTVKEKIVVLDQGKEIRTASMVTGVPFAVWNTTARRISGSLATGGKCRQDMMRGTWVNVCHGFAHIPNTETVVPMAGLLPLTMDTLGNYEGMFNAKMGPVTVGVPMQGTLNVDPDCYGQMTVVFPSWGGFGAKGVLVVLEEGKEAWLLMTKDVAPGGEESPHMPVMCDIIRMGR